MAQPNASQEPKTNQGTVAEHKQRVVEAARNHAEAQRVAARATTTRPPEGFPKPPTTPSSIPDFMQDKGVVPIQEPPVVQAPQAAPTSSALIAPTSSEEPEWQKVAREKGWKTPEDAVRSYQNLEKEFHARNQQMRQQQQPPQVVYQQPPPAYTPYQQMPIYQPPMVPQPNLVEELAQRYNIPTEDAKRLLPFVGEIANAAAMNAAAQVERRYAPVVQNLSQKVKRQDEMMEIVQDPAMRNPRVQFEVNRILQENPTAFQSEEQPLRWALDRALRNIAQESIRADQAFNSGSIPGFSMTPPVTAGSGSGNRGGVVSQEPSADIAGNYFKLKTADEKREYLRAMGVAQ